MNKKYYIQRSVNGVVESPVDLESTFDMLFIKAEGISTKGEIKNIYTESFAESPSLQVWFPQTVNREATDIVLMFGFRGENRRDNYDSFCDFISGHPMLYWDNVRNREVEIFLKESIEPEDDFIVGDDPYLVAPFKFTNIKGNTKKKV